MAESTRRPLALAAIAVGLGLALLALAAPWLYDRWHAGRIYPGVAAAGVDLGGLTPDEAVARLQSALPGVFGESLSLRDAAADRSWPFTPADFGLAADPAAVAQAALDVGRADADGYFGRFVELLSFRLSEPYDIAAGGFEFDADRARQVLTELASEVNVPPENASILDREGEIFALPAVSGRTLDIEATLAALAEHARRPVTDTLDIVLGGTAARVFDVTDVAEAWRVISSGPITMTWREGQVYPIGLDQLTTWVKIEDIPNAEGDRVPSIVADRGAIREWLAPKAAAIDHPSRDARYGFDPGTGRVIATSPSLAAVALDLDGSVENVIRTAYSEQRVGELAARLTSATVRDDLAAELNRTIEAIYQVSTSFGGSPPGRAADLLVLANRFNGVTLAPGQTFSFNRYLGLVTAEAGFDMTGITPPTPAEPYDLAGSLAQVATTAFRAAFWTGLPITERHAPPRRIGWLEPPVGLDAAVEPPETDLQFVNDTGGYLLIKSEIDVAQGRLVWTLYARPTGRAASLVGPTVTDITPAAAPVTRRDPSLPAGQEVQVAWAREGARAVLGRQVTKEGAVVGADSFESAYAPGADVVLVGTGAR